MPRIYLATGRDGPERKIRKNVLHLARWLERQQIDVTVSDQPGGMIWISGPPNWSLHSVGISNCLAAQRSAIEPRECLPPLI